MSWNTALIMLCLAASVAQSVYCLLLSRRLRRLNDLEGGLGGAIAVMCSEVSRLDAAIRQARTEAAEAAAELGRVMDQAREEKAYWALQSELTQHVRPGSGRLRPRMRELREEWDA
ncbi:hypothetical protein [Paracoccus sp. SCSIO 75233]|uniref:hypothetical protein n=1 Tax=Paracoccus sp. SCSIO 75233 TaxID=3017782 RepID=UPI0022F1262B|nr:hypothetical protein [Paracoccus sp. SCSIO 75233]WBU53133.1 hypothetical protein PAF12_15150 [Paracoccus sp. SCSIO 75233]